MGRPKITPGAIPKAARSVFAPPPKPACRRVMLSCGSSALANPMVRATAVRARGISGPYRRSPWRRAQSGRRGQTRLKCGACASVRRAMTEPPVDRAPSAFRPVPRTGVIYVTAEAARAGFRAEDPEWCNLGQGQPETGPLPGAPARVTHLDIALNDQEYAPVAGLWEVREAVANMYNNL